MNQFFKTFIACLLAVVASGILLFFLTAGLLNVLAFGLLSEEETVIPEKAVLKITGQEPISDNADTNPFLSVNPSSLEVIRPVAFLDILNAIERAKYDDRIEGIYLEPALTMRMSIANLEELRNALNDFRSSGKFIVSYADSYSQGVYYLASVANTVILNPEGTLAWRGLVSQTLFYKETLEKLEIRPEIIRHGKYKSAIEPFTESQMSEANREQTEQMLRSIWNNLLSGIGEARGIAPERLDEYASRLAVTDAEKALELKMIDRIGYRHDAEEFIKQQTGDTLLNAVSLPDYIISAVQPLYMQNKSTNRIAVVYAEGEIIDGKGNSQMIGSVSFSNKLRQAREDESVKAVVVRVNSPGGSALAAESIWHEMSLLQQEKPVIVSMGSYAASGGYYMSAPADVILCSPGTITGSIGVFGMLFNAQEGLRNKLGIQADAVKTNPAADIGSPFRPMSEPERQYLQQSVDRIYDTFVGHVAAGRNMSVAEVDSIAQGRVWSGVDAVRVGLADGYGGLKEAVAIAADRAGITDSFKTVTITGQQGRFSQLLEALGSASVFGIGDDPIIAGYLRIKNLTEKNPVQAALWAVPVIE